MIKFFRIIRQRLLTENKFGKYLIYAIGEIVLVVIGILIALQINNANELRKINQLKISYTQSLILDLKNDSILLAGSIVDIEKKMEALLDLWERIYKTETDIDSLINIARFEFDPLINSPVIFNNNTFNILVSSGSIDLFESNVTQALMQLNSSQLEQTKGVDFQKELYMHKALSYTDIYTFDVSDGRSNRRSPIQELVWENIDHAKFASQFISLVEFKILFYMNNISGTKELKLETEHMLALLKG